MIAKIYPQGHKDITDAKHPVRYFDIRRLTERECFRLMGVPENDIDKILGTGITAGQLYRLAGNSIVVNCLFEIYKQIWHGKPNEYSLFKEEFRLPMQDTIRMITLCSGYDSQAIAMKQLCDTYGMKYELLNWSEFDPDSRKPIEQQPACVAHDAVFPEWRGRNLGDMTKINWNEQLAKYRERGITDIDLLTYSTPCQSISAMGKREGMTKDSGTHSAILWHTENAIKVLRPKVLIQENVAAITYSSNETDFREWRNVVANLGYDNYYTILNAKNFGVAQNRERMFMVSIRKDLDMPQFEFPQGSTKVPKLEDFIDCVYNEKYMFSDESVVKYLRMEENGDGVVYVATDHRLTEREIENARQNN